MPEIENPFSEKELQTIESGLSWLIDQNSEYDEEVIAARKLQNKLAARRMKRRVTITIEANVQGTDDARTLERLAINTFGDMGHRNPEVRTQMTGEAK